MLWGKNETNRGKFNVNIHPEDKLITYQYLDHDMELKHPKSLYKHKQLHLPSSQVDTQLNRHKCHYNMLQAKELNQIKLLKFPAVNIGEIAS